MAEVRFMGELSEIVGSRNISVDVSSIDEIFRYLRSRYEKRVMKLAKSMIITVNNTDIRLLNGNATSLSDDDIVNFYPPAAGG